MTVINTNSAALMARAYGEKASQNMLKPIKRLSSGLRINSASDDAAGLAVSNKMTARHDVKQPLLCRGGGVQRTLLEMGKRIG